MKTLTESFGKQVKIGTDDETMTVTIDIQITVLLDKYCSGHNIPPISLNYGNQDAMELCVMCEYSQDLINSISSKKHLLSIIYDRIDHEEKRFIKMKSDFMVAHLGSKNDE